MKLRPRYSLLTLLVLTALVAGGVKWWYGPHRVIERTSPGLESEYAFTRDWRGNQVLHGVYIERHQAKHANRLAQVQLNYFRDGINTGNMVFVNAYPPGSNWRTNTSWCGQTLPLNELESQELFAAKELERTRIRSLGLVPD
jgi:hypothetical protein